MSFKLCWMHFNIFLKLFEISNNIPRAVKTWCSNCTFFYKLCTLFLVLLPKQAMETKDAEKIWKEVTTAEQLSCRWIIDKYINRCKPNTDAKWMRTNRTSSYKVRLWEWAFIYLPWKIFYCWQNKISLHCGIIIALCASISFWQVKRKKKIRPETKHVNLGSIPIILQQASES